MKTSKKILIALITLAVLFINVLLFYHLFLTKEEVPVEEGKLIQWEDTDDYRSNLSLYENTISEKDEVNIPDMPQRVTVTGTTFLLNNGFPVEGVNSLSYYLDLYFNYYQPDGPNYAAEVIESSYVENDSYPGFKILVHISGEETMEVFCAYMKSVDRYNFYSELSGDAKR